MKAQKGKAAAPEWAARLQTLRAFPQLQNKFLGTRYYNYSEQEALHQIPCVGVCFLGQG